MVKVFRIYWKSRGQFINLGVEWYAMWEPNYRIYSVSGHSSYVILGIFPNKSNKPVDTEILMATKRSNRKKN